jgi:tetratricopeptide (TPR) repeat protein
MPADATLIPSMHRLFTPLLRRLYGLLTVVLVAWHAVPAALNSEWNRARLLHEMETGDTARRSAAARELTRLRAEDELLQALQSARADVRSAAAGALFDLWLNSAGYDARVTLFEAFQSVQKKHFNHALALFTQVLEEHPGFSEAWNRRAALRTNLGQFDLALDDARRAVLLNPANFAAWQVMGVCHMRLGHYEAAVRTLKEARRLAPFDATSRQLLRRCLQLRREPAMPLPPSRWREIV